MTRRRSSDPRACTVPAVGGNMGREGSDGLSLGRPGRPLARNRRFVSESALASQRDRRRWRLQLALICGVALVIRAGYVLLFQQSGQVLGDSYQYHYGANLLVDGKGFIDAYAYKVLRATTQTALHPPMATVALAIPSALGLNSILDHQLWSSLMGTTTVAVTGLVGRRLGGPRAGLIAAAVMAVYPNAWLVDALLGLETLSLLTTTVTVLAAYRLWHRPSLLRAAILGMVCAVAALTRGEAVLFLPLVAVPTIWAVRAKSPERLSLALVTTLAMGATLAPWVGFNAGRFHHPILIGRYDVAFVAANCDDTYYGTSVGYWSRGCIPYRPVPKGNDESDDAKVLTRLGVDYVKAHPGRLPFVVFARVGRTFGFYRPAEQVKIEGFAEGRPFQVGRAGLVAYYLLMVAAIPGAFVLRRRRKPVSPLLGLVATGAITVAATYGLTRFRITAEPAIVLLAAFGIDGAISAWWPRRRWKRLGVGNRPGAGKPPRTSAPAAAG